MTTSYPLSLTLYAWMWLVWTEIWWMIDHRHRLFRIAECRWPVRWSMCSQLLSCVRDELESTHTRTHTEKRRARDKRKHQKSILWRELRAEKRWTDIPSCLVWGVGRCTASLSFKVERQTVDHVHDYIIVILGVRNFLIRWARTSKKKVYVWDGEKTTMPSSKRKSLLCVRVNNIPTRLVMVVDVHCFLLLADEPLCLFFLFSSRSSFPLSFSLCFTLTSIYN